MKPCTPRNGTELHEIFGNAETANLMPLLRSVSMFHGPVIQKAALPVVNAFCAVPESTFALISFSLFHLSISDALARNFLFASEPCSNSMPA